MPALNLENNTPKWLRVKCVFKNRDNGQQRPKGDKLVASVITNFKKITFASEEFRRELLNDFMGRCYRIIMQYSGGRCP